MATEPKKDTKTTTKPAAKKATAAKSATAKSTTTKKTAAVKKTTTPAKKTVAAKSTATKTTTKPKTTARKHQPKVVAERGNRKTRQGIVTSDKADKTIVISVTSRKAHPLYGKMITSSKKYHAHDAKNEAHVGDIVRIMETRPLSALKRWRLLEIVEKSK